MAIMSISERVTRGLSLWLITALAATTVGWTAAGRDGTHCTTQDHPCAPEAALACCCHSLPDLSDAARLPGARPLIPPSNASLMEFDLPSAPLPCAAPRCRLVPFDLTLLHRTFLI
jgi:hypothetical protein